METRYSVRQAADMTGVKAYVLRYWEDELELRIQRNEMGHRYYTGYDIQLFLNIKELKTRGLQLRAIKDLLPQIEGTISEKKESELQLLEAAAAVDTSETREEETAAFPNVQNEKILEFQAILERLITQELQYKNEEEERCRSLDLAIRRQQMARKEAAAALAEKKTRRRFKNT